MKSLLDGKTILVAGAGGLLGRQLVCGILAQGAKVIVADIDVEKAKVSLASLSVDINSPLVEFCKFDIANLEDVKKIFSEESCIDGAVNCTYPRNKNYGAHFFDVTLDSFNENLSLHLGSYFLFSQQCAAYFKVKRRPFSLVNISSIYGVVAPEFSIYKDTPMTMPVEYAAIKSGLLHLSKYIAKYIGDSDFRINCVSPGGVLDDQPEQFLNKYRERTHGRGMLHVENVIGAVLFLLSEQSQYMVGQNLIVDDGFTL